MIVESTSDDPAQVLKDHIEKITGVVNVGVNFKIDGRLLLCHERLNVYAEKEAFNFSLLSVGKNPKDYEHSFRFAEWLMAQGKVTFVDSETVLDDVQNFPISLIAPIYHDILKVMTIAAFTLSPEEIAQLNSENIYYYTVGREFLKGFKQDRDLTPLQNFLLICTVIKSITDLVISVWHMTEGRIVSAQQDTLNSVTFGGMSPLDAEIFKTLMYVEVPETA